MFIAPHNHKKSERPHLGFFYRSTAKKMAQEKQEKQQPTQVSVRGKSPWVEKYRPKHLVDVIGATEHLQRFKAIVDSGNMLNLMFSGPPGIGKTTIALCMAQALLGPLGPNVFDEAVLELNASDDRGVDVIHNKIKTFAKKHLELKGRHKLILLDEADSMEPAAQHALCCIIEVYYCCS
jgi:replication factor C subunit 2/4